MNLRIKTIFQLLLVTLVLTFASCEKDLYEDAIHQHKESKYTITEKSFDELLADNKFNAAYNKINKTKGSNSFSKTVMEVNYNFTLVNLPAKVIQNGNNTTYTFQISRDTINEKYFENLIIGVDSLNQTKAYISKYEIDNQTNPFSNNIAFKNVTYTSIVYDNSAARLTDCITFLRSLCNGVPYDCGGNICGFEQVTYCSGSGTASNTGTGTSWGGSTSTGEAGSSTGSSTTTTPVFAGGSGGTGSLIPLTNARKFFTSFATTSLERELLLTMSPEASTVLSNYLNNNAYPSTISNAVKTFITNLSQNMEWFTSQTTQTQSSIINYLTQNNFSSNSRNLVNQIINLSQTYNVELDFNSGNALQNFNSINELESHIQAIQTTSEDNTPGNSSVNSQNQNFSTKTIDLNSIIELTIEIVSNPLPTFTLDNNGCTSYISNIVVGNTWVQNSISLTNQNYNATTAQVTIVGYVNVGVKLDALEFGIKQRKKIVLLINKLTGNIYSTSVSNLN